LPEEILLDLIHDNPYNSRLEYKQEEIDSLARSLDRFGILCPIKVRALNQEYHIVYGHRRVRAARSLGWSKIKAELGSYSNEEMLELSLAENSCRKDLSDYELALVFKRMSIDFGKTYDEIGNVVGLSKTHVCNYLRMTRLFENSILDADASLRRSMFKISEHHARILLQVEDPQTRANLLKLAVTDSLSVRDLERMISKLRGWFRSNRDEDEIPAELDPSDKRDSEEIRDILTAEFNLPHHGDFESFQNLHSFGPSFSVYSIASFSRLENEAAIQREKEWFYSMAPKTTPKIRNLRVQVFGNVAIATLHVHFDSDSTWKAWRGTVCFIRKSGHWKIIHEHYSEVSPLSVTRLVHKR
jgi:ParB family transcriptional regulator, chromosome partitioning protein